MQKYSTTSSGKPLKLNISIKNLWRFVLVAILVLTAAGTGLTAKCEPIDREKSISKILDSNPGSKVLKVAEQTDEDGCAMLKIRILVDGTVKAVTVNSKGT